METIHFLKIHRYEYIDNDKDDVVTDLLITTQSTLSKNINCCLGYDKTNPSERNHVMEMKRIPDVIQCQQKLDDLRRYDNFPTPTSNMILLEYNLKIYQLM